ncbi:hypothetical protein LWC34_14345 [Kibdelosporangium philippinense]|uniref:Uncharacterized protein n=1 Tax=Kibdelosporangium philippinense TaxID=211113 RepID=A0ABS8ZBD4_9PSEU|nr:hypothetical protein [Kibdelosporangium philippinense]MCE7004001.1 hypothetical protein [Kibdelosporangium philippinense]
MWTKNLRILVVACSIIFTAGTALHGFVVIDEEVLARTMELALIIHVGDVSACAGSDVDLELVAVW